LPTGFTVTNLSDPLHAIELVLGTNAHTGTYDFTLTATANNLTDPQLSKDIVGSYSTTITVNDPTITIVSPNSNNLLTHYRGMN
jgi:hypothetical protein